MSAQKPQQIDKKVVASQAKLMRQRSSTYNSQQEYTPPKPSVVVKPHTKNPKPVDAPQNVVRPIPFVEKAPEKSRATMTTEIDHELIGFIAKNTHPAKVENIEPTETLSLAHTPSEPEAEIIENARMPEVEAENMDRTSITDSQILEMETITGDTAELFDNEPQPIMLDDLAADMDLEETEPVGLLAELSFLEFERLGNPTESSSIETPPPVLSKQIAEHIETLELARSEEAAAILDTVLEKIEQMLVFNEDDGSETINHEAIPQDLETLCARLLICVELEPISERINYLLQTLTSEVEERIFSAAKSTSDKGTHERKQDFGLLLSDWVAWVDGSLAHVMGQYVVRLTTQYSMAVT